MTTRRKQETVAPDRPTLTHSPDASFAFRIHVLSNLISRPFHAIYGKQEDVNQSEWRMLQVLDTHPGIPFSEICHRTGMHKMQVSRAVQRGIRLGRVSMTDDAGDARRKLVELTSKGRALCQRMYPRTTEREESLVNALSPAQRQALDDLLDRMIVHMQTLSE